MAVHMQTWVNILKYSSEKFDNLASVKGTQENTSSSKKYNVKLRIYYGIG